VIGQVVILQKIIHGHPALVFNSSINMLRKFIIQVAPTALDVVLKFICIKKYLGLLKYN